MSNEIKLYWVERSDADKSHVMRAERAHLTDENLAFSTYKGPEGRTRLPRDQLGVSVAKTPQEALKLAESRLRQGWKGASDLLMQLQRDAEQLQALREEYTDDDDEESEGEGA